MAGSLADQQQGILSGPGSLSDKLAQLYGTPPEGGGGGPVTTDSITDATSLGKNLIKAADATAARTALGAASTSQGTKADSAVQPEEIEALVEGVLGADPAISITASYDYDDPDLATKLGALAVGSVVAIIGPEAT